jgi:uncharacterized protein RhaS with RHS repeats
MYQPELGRFLQPDPKEFAAGDYNLYRYCHNDPVNRSDPTGLISNITVELQKLTTVTGSNIPQWVTIAKGIASESLKAAFTALVKAAVGNPIPGKPGKTDGDHVDRTQSIYKDSSPSEVTKATLNKTLTRGTFTRPNHFEEVVPHDKPIAWILHFHNDLQNVSTATWSKNIDDEAVKGYKAPMIFSSESLYKHNQGILLTPNGKGPVSEIPVSFNW